MINQSLIKINKNGSPYLTQWKCCVKGALQTKKIAVSCRGAPRTFRLNEFQEQNLDKQYQIKVKNHDPEHLLLSKWHRKLKAAPQKELAASFEEGLECSEQKSLRNGKKYQIKIKKHDWWYFIALYRVHNERNNFVALFTEHVRFPKIMSFRYEIWLTSAYFKSRKITRNINYKNKKKNRVQDAPTKKQYSFREAPRVSRLYEV